jgi:hypothetical protein
MIQRNNIGASHPLLFHILQNLIFQLLHFYTTSGSPYLLVFPPNSVCRVRIRGASSAGMMSSTNCIFSALLNVSSLRRASSSALVLTVCETVASLLLVKVFKSWVYSL